jgi:hypothetical protein
MAVYGVEPGRAFGQKMGLRATGAGMFADEAKQQLLATVLEAQKKANEALSAKRPREEAKEAKQGGRPPRGGGDQRQRSQPHAYQPQVYAAPAYQAPAYAAPSAYPYGQGLSYAPPPQPVQFAPPAPAPSVYAQHAPAPSMYAQPAHSVVQQAEPRGPCHFCGGPGHWKMSALSTPGACMVPRARCGLPSPDCQHAMV